MNFKNNENIINKSKINIHFYGKLDISSGSDRIFCLTFSNFLNNLVNCSSEIFESPINNLICDIAIFKKDYPLKKLKEFAKKETSLIGIVNPSDKSNNSLASIDIADFAIVGSIEEKAYYSKYLKCFVYPLIEEIEENNILDYQSRPDKTICYHGNKQHLDFININIEKALIRLKSEGYKFRAVYDFKKLGKCKKKFITDHIQWEENTWLNEISNSTVGVFPSTHYPGFIRSKLSKLISRKRILRNDYLLQYKNTSNASRAFVFHQLKIPVVAEIGGSIHHILGDEECGYICYSEKSWYDSISRLCKDKNLNKRFAEKASILMKTLYDPNIWCDKFINEMKFWVLQEFN